MHPSLFAREDTLLGVCEGLGEELRVEPIYFRIACALALFWNPIATVVGYLAIGIVFALFRWAFPLHRPVIDTRAAPLEADNDDAVVPRADAA